jgi:hypothetical protein
MGISWTNGEVHFKSPLRVVVRFLFRSREATREKCRRLKEQVDQDRRWAGEQGKVIQRQRKIIEQVRGRVQRLEDRQGVRGETAGLSLPEDPPVGSHGYGARMITLAVRLSQAVGLRGAERALKIMFEWLEIEQKTPHYTSIRHWMQRVGVAELNKPLEPGDDWVWIVDHSNQIGAEKVLVVLGVRASRLPPPGTALKHEDVRLLALRSSTSWKREDMAAVYTELAERYGAPRAVLSDGAVELRDGAECLKTRRSDSLSLQDFKHKAANLFKALVGKSERFDEFRAQLARTRSAIQQTELGHLTPPAPKQKARFMNLAATLRWASVMLWLLDHPEAETRRGLTRERLEEKLGWLRSFADDLAAWRECQQVLQCGIKRINEHGLFTGASEQLRVHLGADLLHASSRELADRLIHFVAEAERSLKPGERLPMSTEVLESTFSLYKRLERQHAKGGFTSLLPTFGALLTKVNPESLRQSLQAVSVKDVKQWLATHLGRTLTAKRLATYREAQQPHKTVTIMTATP